MKIIITENQLKKLVEDNDYFDYENVSASDKDAFYKINAGYPSGDEEKPNKKGKLLYAKIMKWTGGKLDDDSSFKSEQARFKSVSLAKAWLNKQGYNKKYFRLIYVYDNK